MTKSWPLLTQIAVLIAVGLPLSASSTPLTRESFSSVREFCEMKLGSPNSSNARETTYLLGEYGSGLQRQANVVVISERAAAPDLLVRRIERRVSFPDTRANWPRVNRDWHLQQVLPLVRFGTENMARRNWSADFYAKMEKTADKYLEDSTYFEVRQKSTNRLLGVIRAIRLPYGVDGGQRNLEAPIVRNIYGNLAQNSSLPRPNTKLPEENFLDIELPLETVGAGNNRRQGVHIEVGTFAIDKTLESRLRTQVWYELWLELTAFVLPYGGSPSQSFYGTALHTYGDEESIKLYSPLGFDYLRSYRQNGQDVVHDDGEVPPPIEKEGTHWWPLVWYPNDIADLNQKILEGQKALLRRADPIARREAKGDGAAHDLQDIDRLLSNFRARSDNLSAQAQDSLLRSVQVAVAHYRQSVSRESSRAQAQRAREAFSGSQAIFAKIETGLAQMRNTGSPGQRLRLIDLIAGMIWEFKEGVPRAHLTDESLIRNFVLPALADPDFGVVRDALFIVYDLKPEGWLRTVGTSPQRSIPARLNNVVQDLKTMWQKPTWISSSPDGNRGMYNYAYIDNAAITLFGLEDRRPEALAALLSAAASP